MTEMDLPPDEIELCSATNYQRLKSAPLLIACLSDLRVQNWAKLKKFPSALKKTVYQLTWSQCLHLFAVSDRGGASHGCDTGWIRAAAARPCCCCCCCSAPLVQPPGSALCSALRAQRTLLQRAVLVCAHPAWETRRLAGKFGASRAGAPPSPWSKSLSCRCCSAARKALQRRTLPVVEQAVRRASAQPGSVSGSRGSFSSALCCTFLYEKLLGARAPPIPLGKDLPLLSTRWRAPATSISVVSEFFQ